MPGTRATPAGRFVGVTPMPDAAAITLYHHGGCSKSRGVKALLDERGLSYTVVEYQRTPLDAAALRALAATLGLPARALLRADDAAALDPALADPALPDTAAIAALVAQPALLQRPIVVTARGGAICRPAERVLDLL